MVRDDVLGAGDCEIEGVGQVSRTERVHAIGRVIVDRRDGERFEIRLGSARTKLPSDETLTPFSAPIWAA